MKHVAVVMFLIVSSLSFGQDTATRLNWLTNIEKAEKISKKSKKPILVYFTGSDWCAPCIKLKQDFFDSEEFIEKAENMVLVMIDKPRRVDIISKKQMEYNNSVIKEYNPNKTFPRMIFLNHKGKVLDEMSGYSYYGETSNHFDFINKNI